MDDHDLQASAAGLGPTAVDVSILTIALGCLLLRPYLVGLAVWTRGIDSGANLVQRLG